MENASLLKPQFDTLNDLVNIILEVTKYVIEFHDLPTQYITQDISAYTTAYNYIPVASYWTVRSIVVCTTLITRLTTQGYEIFTTTDTWELSTLTFKLKNIINHLRQLLDSCSKYTNKQTEMISTGSASMMDDEDHQMLCGLLDLFLTPQTDNMKILKSLIYSGDDILPLYDCRIETRVSLEPLRRKHVLLLFSGLEISINEIITIEHIYYELKSCYLVWIPIVDLNSEWTEREQEQFERLQKRMRWYSVYHPSLIVKPVISFIKREWRYKNKPIIVVLDPQGRVSCPNAIHMMWIWGSDAYPFTSSTEASLWKEVTWRFELLISYISTELLTSLNAANSIGMS